jgi:hypothetical protein
VTPTPRRQPMVECPHCGALNDPARGSRFCVSCGLPLDDPPKGAAPAPQSIQTRSDAVALGRAHARARGDHLTPTQIVRLAALIRPHLDEPRAKTA